MANNCSKTLKCGHNCCGYRDEVNCMVCLEDGCDKNNKIDGNDYCNICFTESLKSGPCIRTDCGHIFHFLCVLKRLEIGWNGPRITFSFLLCPLCK